MGEEAFRDVFGNHVVLRDEVRDHVSSKHPEMRLLLDLIGRVLADPDEIRVSNSNPRVVLYYQHDSEVYGGKWLVVVVKRLEPHFVSTFYVTHRPKAGDKLWSK